MSHSLLWLTDYGGNWTFLVRGFVITHNEELLLHEVGSWDLFLIWDRKEAALGILAFPSLASEEGGPSRPPGEGGWLTRAHWVAELGCDFRAHQYPVWGSFHVGKRAVPAHQELSDQSWCGLLVCKRWPQLSLHLIFPHLQRRKPTSWFLFWIPDHLIHSPNLVIYLWLFLSGCPFSLLPSSIIFSLCWALKTLPVLINLLNAKIWLFFLSQLVSLHVAGKVSYLIILLLRGL